YRKKFIATGESATLDRAIDLYRQFLATPTLGRERAAASDAIAELLLLRAKRAPPEPAPAADSAAPKERPSQTELMLVAEAPEPPAPLLATVSRGEHRVRATAPGFFAESTRVTAIEGRFVVSELRLKPRPAVLAIAGRPGTALHLDGLAIGAVPLEHVEVAAG